ncbi:hypothetical protein PTKU46_87470 [Paraburkholderia terrae]
MPNGSKLYPRRSEQAKTKRSHVTVRSLAHGYLGMSGTASSVSASWEIPRSKHVKYGTEEAGGTQFVLGTRS